MENLDLKDSEVSPVSLIRDIAPRSMKVKSFGENWEFIFCNLNLYAFYDFKIMSCLEP